MSWSRRRLVKEFPDMRLNEREMKFIRVGDVVRTVSRENRHWMGALHPLLYPGYKAWDRGLAGPLLIGWGRYTEWTEEHLQVLLKKRPQFVSTKNILYKFYKSNFLVLMKVGTETMHFRSIKISGQWIVTTSFFSAIKDIAVGYHFDHKTKQFLQGKAFPGSRVCFNQIPH